MLPPLPPEPPAPPTSDTHSGPEGPKTFRSPILNQYQDLLQELLLSVHPHPHAYNLWQIARKLPTTPSQERHRVILKKLARNGHPHITLDREIVDGFNFDDPRKRLKDQMFAGFAVDNIYNDEKGWYITFLAEDCAARAARTINIETFIVSVHKPPVILVGSLEAKKPPSTIPHPYAAANVHALPGNTYDLAQLKQRRAEAHKVSMLQSMIRPRVKLRLAKERSTRGSPSSSEGTLSPSPTPTERSRSVTPSSPLKVNSSILGHGRRYTILRGTLGDVPVTIKYHRNLEVADYEILMLKKCVTAENILRCLYHDKRSGFSRLALESYTVSLTDLMDMNKHDVIVTLGPKALKEITSGVGFLHARGIVHCNINPDNIVLRGDSKGNCRMLVTNIEHSKQLEKDETSFASWRCGSLGPSRGWFAPELLGAIKHVTKQAGNETSTSHEPPLLTKAIDIFALGCIFFYILTRGGHPFGNMHERDNNVLQNAMCLNGVECMRARNLIMKMLSSVESERPNVSSILRHPYFWDSNRCLQFLLDSSDYLEHIRSQGTSVLMSRLELGAHKIFGANWGTLVDLCFIDTHGKRMGYNTRSVKDLLRTIRNNKHHYHDLPQAMKETIGILPDGYLTYFTTRFPNLFMHLYDVISGDPSSRCENTLHHYFGLAG